MKIIGFVVISLLCVAGCANEQRTRVAAAKKLLARRNFGGAIAELASYKEKKDGEIQFLLGACYLGDGKLGDATFHFYQAIKAKPELQDSVAFRWTKRALELNRVGDFDRAVRCFEKAVVLKPDLGASLFILGDIFFNKGEYARAAENYVKGLEGSADSLSRAKAYEGLVKSYMQVGDWAQAQQAAEKGINERHYFLAVLQGEVAYNFARTMYGNGNLDSAQVLVGRTIEIGRPTYLLDDAYYLLGEILFAKADFANAQSAYESVLRHDPYLRGGLVRRVEERLKMIKGILNQ